jgi:SAM-dependent methyltransferase
MPDQPHRLGDYTADYYATLQAGGRASAERVLPRVLAMVQPSSVVDFGCGSGGWLATAAALGVADIQGVDGAWVVPDTLEFPGERFRAVDLAAPLDLGRRYDLAFCLEVAEHLPPDAAPVLVDTLTAHAPAVLFSAAIPGQGGEGHVNEAWQSFWQALFTERGFECFDVLRGPLWTDPAIEVWYRQNLLLFVRQGDLAKTGRLPARPVDPSAAALDLVHPELFAGEVRAREERDEDLRRFELAYEAQSAELAELKAEVDRIGAAWSGLHDELSTMRGSLSWRLTAPLRAVGRWMARAPRS